MYEVTLEAKSAIELVQDMIRAYAILGKKANYLVCGGQKILRLEIECREIEGQNGKPFSLSSLYGLTIVRVDRDTLEIGS